jgi:hypothetical protein
MKCRVLALACLISTAATRPADAESGADDVRRFAIVIGNNQPEKPQSSVLRYADDDAVATHRLLVEAGVDSTLLVRLDEDSRGLYPKLDEHGPPRSQDLDRALARAFTNIRESNERGRRTELLVFYSGHGDVDRGEGYVVLEDGRLTRSRLYSLLAQSPAVLNHVFVDACKSYYLAFDRGPGGHRSPYTLFPIDQSIPANLSNTGFVLSTSSDRDSHEWERFQAGILSHELRSALRGAADVNGDGGVTYAELGAFLSAANQSIPNPRFRPDFLVRPPGRDLKREVLRWSSKAPALYLSGEGTLDHFYVEATHGERVLDAHPSRHQPLVLHVPAERPLFVRLNDETAEYVVNGHRSVQLDTLVAVTPAIGRRGALNLAFERLFATPFGDADVLSYVRRATAEPIDKTPPRDLPRTRQLVGTVSGSIAIGAAATSLTLGIISAERYLGGAGASQTEILSRNRQVHNLNVASIAFLAVAGAAGLTWGCTKLWPETGASVEVSSGDPGGWRGAILEFRRAF